MIYLLPCNFFPYCLFYCLWPNQLLDGKVGVVGWEGDYIRIFKIPCIIPQEIAFELNVQCFSLGVEIPEVGGGF